LGAEEKECLGYMNSKFTPEATSWEAGAWGSVKQIIGKATRETPEEYAWQNNHLTHF